MRLWRLETLEYLETALEGIGAEKYSGRWNLPGTPMLYLSTCLSLAAHEKFVHVPRNARYTSLVALGVDVPDAAVVKAERPAPLPSSWRAPKPQRAAQQWGSSWATGGSSLAAAVPSLLLPLDLYVESMEFNVLINPKHPEMARVTVAAELAYHFDSRAWKDPQ